MQVCVAHLRSSAGTLRLPNLPSQHVFLPTAVGAMVTMNLTKDPTEAAVNAPRGELSPSRDSIEQGGEAMGVSMTMVVFNCRRDKNVCQCRRFLFAVQADGTIRGWFFEQYIIVRSGCRVFWRLVDSVLLLVGE